MQDLLNKLVDKLQEDYGEDARVNIDIYVHTNGAEENFCTRAGRTARVAGQTPKTTLYSRHDGRPPYWGVSVKLEPGKNLTHFFDTPSTKELM